MGQFISRIWLVVVICIAGISSAYAERFDKYFLSEQQLPEIEAVGVSPSSNAWVLFEQFAKRFSLIPTADDQGGERDIRRITEAGGGDRNALVFLLLNLFRWNGIDAELVLLSTKLDSELGDDYIEHMLVYVHALKQYFDPTLLPAAQHKSSDLTWLHGRRRMHFAAALRHSGKVIGRCSDLCLSVSGPQRNSHAVGHGKSDPYAVRVKTIRVPATGAEKSETK